MNKIIALGVGAVLLLLLLIFSTTYTVSFDEVAIRKTFGDAGPGSVTTDAGLKWKWPIIQDKTRYDKRLQIKESPMQEISTADGLQLVVKGFLLWRIDTDTPEGPLAFDRNFGAISEAEPALTDPLSTAMAGVLSEYRLDDLLGADNQLADAESKITAALSGLLSKGIRPVQVGVSQVLLPEATTNSVITRMQRSRQALADAKRTEGAAKAEAITSEAATSADQIRRFAELRAADIRSQAEAQAAEYVEQMSEEESLALFLVWLDTLEATINEAGTFVLSTDFAPFHLLQLSGPTDAQGIPQAAGDSPPARRELSQGDLRPLEAQIEVIRQRLAELPAGPERTEVEALLTSAEELFTEFQERSRR